MSNKISDLATFAKDYSANSAAAGSHLHGMLQDAVKAGAEWQAEQRLASLGMVVVTEEGHAKLQAQAAEAEALRDKLADARRQVDEVMPKWERQRETIGQLHSQLQRKDLFIAAKQSDIDALNYEIDTRHANLKMREEIDQLKGDLKRAEDDRDWFKHSWQNVVGRMAHDVPAPVEVDESGVGFGAGAGIASGDTGGFTATEAMRIRNEEERGDPVPTLADRVEETASELRKADMDRMLYGTGVVHIDNDGSVQHIPLSAFVMKAPRNPGEADVKRSTDKGNGPF